MIALDLIESIFARPQHGPSNLRHITPDQLKYLRDLIAKDAQCDRVRNGMGGSLVWTPAGKYKYVLTEDLAGGKRHTLTRLGNLEAPGMGSLF